MTLVEFTTVEVSCQGFPHMHPEPRGMTKGMWMVRAGRSCELLDRFQQDSIVGVGWQVEAAPGEQRAELLARMSSTYPELSKAQAVSGASQLFRFVNEIAVGDAVITYDSSRRIYWLGEIVGPPQQLREDVGLHHVRQVRWDREISRDLLSVPTRNTLGSISTLFRLNDSAAADLFTCGQSCRGSDPFSEAAERPSDERVLLDLQARAREATKDRLAQLPRDEMQELVAGLLRAMGYKTRISPRGPDRGMDILASPDGFGFESPRIVVEVKHRQAAMGSEAIRSFLGGRHRNDKGLYVSTGGFSKEARYEADRASIPLVLMDLDDLVDGVLANYETMDAAVRPLLPLARVYWPL